MPADLTNYQCPACTAPLHFKAETGKLECDYCGSTFEPEEIEKLYRQKEEAAAGAFERHEDNIWNGEGMKSYSCPSCGAELVCDESTAATSCPYCGNPTVVPGQFHEMLKPDYIIPFKKSKEEALAALKSHYKGKILLPQAFKTENHIEEIKGVYVPFWLFYGDASGGIRCKCTNSMTHREGNYEVVTTEHFNVTREGHCSFERVPTDASSKMPDEHMDAIEPYDYSELKPFSTAYMPGFLADKYDVQIEECTPRMQKRCTEAFEQSLRDTVHGYSTCTVENRHLQTKKRKTEYALMPVWMLTTRWNGKTFLFAMNGQTGKMVGDLPTSRARLAALFAAVYLPLAAVLAMIFLMR